MNKAQRLHLLSTMDNTNPYKHFSLKRNSKVLIIDGMNTFIRCFAADNKHNIHGAHIGGISGFLKSVAYAIRTEMPTRCVIIFDGEGGSTNRQYLYPQYKRNRENAERIINWVSFKDKKEEDRAKASEIDRLIDYLKLLPLTLIAIHKLEADDVISYVTRKIVEEDEENKVCIMSSDRDFFQLVNKQVYVYSPTKKKYYFEQEVLNEFKSTPQNYLLYKCFLGDDSDNIKGIHGLGEKKMAELLPDAFSGEPTSLEKIYELCETPMRNSVLYERILNCKLLLELNKKVMNLSELNLSDKQIEQIESDLAAPVSVVRKYDFIKLYYKDGMSGSIPNVDNWINCFSPLNSFNK